LTASPQQETVPRLRIDTHVHSEASYDGHEPVELLLEHAADIGLDGIIVTDHDVMYASLRAAELAPEYGLVGIPGVEVSTTSGHLLAVGVDEMPPRGAPLAKTVAWVRDRGGVAIVPHPFQRSRHGVSKRVLKRTEADAIEVYNSWLFTGYTNRRARRFAERRHYPGVAGSDAHIVPFVGRAFTELDVDERSAAGVLDAIRCGETAARGRRQPLPVSTRHYASGAARKSTYYARVGARKGGRAAVTGAATGVRLLAGLL
jgi:predicted metal-dependent phosphoesterase TrpH